MREIEKDMQLIFKFRFDGEFWNLLNINLRNELDDDLYVDLSIELNNEIYRNLWFGLNNEFYCELNNKLLFSSNLESGI